MTTPPTNGNWRWAPGTARSLRDIPELNDYSVDGITRAGMERLKTELLRCGSMEAVNLNGLRADRAPVLPGGLAIMLAIFEELGIEQMTVTLARCAMACCTICSAASITRICATSPSPSSSAAITWTPARPSGWPGWRAVLRPVGRQRGDAAPGNPASAGMGGQAA